MDAKYSIKNKQTNSSIIFRNANTPELEAMKMLLEVSNNFEIYDKDPSMSYEDVTNYIHNYVENSEFLCKTLNPKYLKIESYNNADIIIVLSTPGINILPNGNIFGFALLELNEFSNSVNIDVICTHEGIKYAGERLLGEIEKIARALMMTEIRLKSLKSSIGFYEKYGFVKKINTTNLNLIYA